MLVSTSIVSNSPFFPGILLMNISSTGTAFFKEEQHGLMAQSVSLSALSRRVLHLRTNSTFLLKREHTGITPITVGYLQVWATKYTETTIKQPYSIAMVCGERWFCMTPRIPSYPCKSQFCRTVHKSNGKNTQV